MSAFNPYTYPNRPGFKARETARDAADAMAPKAPKLRDRVLASIRLMPATPETVAERLGEPLMNVRPRLSELAAKNLIEDSGQRGPASGGRTAIIWRATNADGN